MPKNDTDASVQEKRSLLGLPISETIILTAAPVLAYVFTFAYQAGYFDTFNLPRQFISVNLIDVLNIGGKVLLIFAVAFGCIDFLFSFLPKRIYHHAPLAERISIILPVLLLVIPLLLFYDDQEGRIAVASLMVIVMIILFLPPLLTRRVKGNYLQRMEALDSERSPSSDPWKHSASLVRKLVDIIGRKVFLFVVYFIASVSLVYHGGRASGLNRIVFPVANTSPDAVVLFMTSDRLITAPLDRKAKTIKPVFTITNFDDNPGLTLRLVAVGPLKLKLK